MSQELFCLPIPCKRETYKWQMIPREFSVGVRWNCVRDFQISIVYIKIGGIDVIWDFRFVGRNHWNGEQQEKIHDNAKGKFMGQTA